MKYEVTERLEKTIETEFGTVTLTRTKNSSGCKPLIVGCEQFYELPSWQRSYIFYKYNNIWND